MSHHLPVSLVQPLSRWPISTRLWDAAGWGVGVRVRDCRREPACATLCRGKRVFWGRRALPGPFLSWALSLPVSPRVGAVTSMTTGETLTSVGLLPPPRARKGLGRSGCLVGGAGSGQPGQDKLSDACGLEASRARGERSRRWGTTCSAASGHLDLSALARARAFSKPLVARDASPSPPSTL